MPFFNKLRKAQIKTDGLKRYLLYAVGEIVLVMVGILLALEVNDRATSHADRSREVKYLKNIRLDLEKDVKNLRGLIEFRKAKREHLARVLKHIDGKPVDDLTKLTQSTVNTIDELVFTPNNLTYSEMASSGNLNLISNDSIKLMLLELESNYKSNRFSIDHETFDFREYISKPVFRHLKVEKMFPVFTGEKSAVQQAIKPEDFKDLFTSQEYRNGLLVLTYTSQAFIGMYEHMEQNSRKLIRLIDKELESN